jgi:ATP-dependent DNA helicase RecQ
MVAYAETSISRRKFILHYFGEEFDSEKGDGADMDDNMRYPKTKSEAGKELKILIQTVLDTKEKYKSKEIVKTLIGAKNALILSHRTHEKPFFGIGKDRDAKFWMALLRQSLINGFFSKEIETYGIIKLSPKAMSFLNQPGSFLITADHDYESNQSNLAPKKSQGSTDIILMDLLRSLRKQVSQEEDVPPFAVFQEYSLEDMALKYPISIQELNQINGVGEGKAKRYGAKFIELIKKYVHENEITRPDDLIIKSTGANSALKLYLIQSIDRKLSLEDIASAKGMNMSRLITEMETIVFSGTKLNIDYWINDLFDEDQIEELTEYFMEADTDDLHLASEEFDGDYEDEELRLFRLKFISDVGN